jgi:arginase
VLGLASIVPRTRRTLARLQAARPTRLVTIGGTCGVELAPVSYLNDLYQGDLAVVWLDGHADLNTPASSPSGHFHGMVLRTLLGDGPAALVDQLPRPLAASQVFLVGARDLDPPEQAFIASGGVTLVGEDVFSDPRHLTTLLSTHGFGHVYVHFDVDVINPGDFHGALMHAPGGPSLAAVADVLGALHRHTDVVGFSVLEYVDRHAADRERLLTVLRAVHANYC